MDIDSSASSAELMYQELILERARAPVHGAGIIPFDAEAEGNNPMCGDRLTVQVRRDGSGAIEAVGFHAKGCAITVASADLMADAVHGLSEAEARALASDFTLMVQSGTVPDDPRFEQLRALAGVHAFRSRIRCATLPWSALHEAMSRESVR
jgi:nitrogen fixation NifU-like protein